LEGIDNFVKLIKNNKKMLNKIKYDLDDFDDYIELKKIFDKIICCKNNNKIDEYIEKIEIIINKLYGFQKYVLK
jgi:hypothetical protein